MRHPNVKPPAAPAPGAVLRMSVAACIVAAACFASPASRADAPGAVAASPAAASPSPATTPSLAELRGRYAGFYRYAGDAREQKARLDAIGQSASSFFFAVRGVARSKLEDRTRIMPTCRFEFSDGNIRSTVPGHAVAVSPESGAIAPYRVEDDAIALSQRFDGVRLVQTFKADEGGTRRNEFTLSPDGAWLTMKATLSSPKLSIPVVYTLTYRRVE